MEICHLDIEVKNEWVAHAIVVLLDEIFQGLKYDFWYSCEDKENEE